VSDSHPVILFRCDASPAQGYGHVSRCLAVAHALRKLRQWRVVFALGSDHAQEKIVQHGYEVAVLPPGESLVSWFDTLLEQISPDLLLLDAPQKSSEILAVRQREAGGITVVLDDAGPLRKFGQAAYYPPAPVISTLDWTDCSTEVFTGFQWVPLGDAFVPRQRTVSSGPLRLLITMGGSDPARLTMRAVELLQQPPMQQLDWQATIIVGPYFAFKSELAACVDKMTAPVTLVESPPDMGTYMADCDLAVASFGVSAYELASCGVPAVYYCLTGEHAAMADVFESAGMALNLGVYNTVCPSDAACKVASLLQNPAMLNRMGSQAAEQVDGLGAQRIAADMVRRVEART
tara:strand:- start:30367 stop:31410 length:1044 start_codon:yes stop_codon:yes gene_type:complete